MEDLKIATEGKVGQLPRCACVLGVSVYVCECALANCQTTVSEALQHFL